VRSVRAPERNLICLERSRAFSLNWMRVSGRAPPGVLASENGPCSRNRSFRIDLEVPPEIESQRSKRRKAMETRP
jgi:hypothetical protein